MGLCPPNCLSPGTHVCPHNLPLGKVMPPAHKHTQELQSSRLHSGSKTTDPWPVLPNPVTGKATRIHGKQHSMGALLTCTATQETATGPTTTQEADTHNHSR